MDRRKAGAVAQVLAAAVIWGGSFVATKVALREISPVGIVWLRFGIGLAVLTALRTLQGTARHRGATRELALLALLGFTGTTLHQMLQATGLETASAITTGWIVSATPLFIALLAWIFLHERFTPMCAVGLLLAGAGVTLVIARGDTGALLRGSFGTVGDALVVLAALVWAVFSVISRNLVKGQQPLEMMFFIMLFGWISATILFALIGSPRDLLSVTGSGWAAVLYLGIFSSGLAYLFWYGALKVLPAGVAGAFMYCEPLVTILVAMAVLGETPAALTMAGGGLTILGVWLVARERT